MPRPTFTLIERMLRATGLKVVQKFQPMTKGEAKGLGWPPRLYRGVLVVEAQVADSGFARLHFHFTARGMLHEVAFEES